MEDFNALETAATRYFDEGSYGKAAAVYLSMALGDPSLDAGWIGYKLGMCYEKLHDFHAAKYWYGRAVEENPGIPEYNAHFERFKSLSVGDLLA